MTSLNDAAKRFKAATFTTTGKAATAEPTTGADLDELIAQRLSASLDAPEPDETGPKLTPNETSMGSDDSELVTVESSNRGREEPIEWRIPPAVVRALGDRNRVVIEVPITLEPLRVQAKQLRMTSGHLVLASLTAHQEKIAERANAGDYKEAPKRGFAKQWQLGWHQSELERFDAFVDEVSPMLPRRSRAFVATLLLEQCSGRLLKP